MSGLWGQRPTGKASQIERACWWADVDGFSSRPGPPGGAGPVGHHQATFTRLGSSVKRQVNGFRRPARVAEESSNRIGVASVVINTLLQTDGTMNKTAAINEYAQKRREQRIADTARRMASEGKSKQELVDYLEGESFPQPTAAADALFGLFVAQEEAKKSARYKAYGTILLGVVVAVVAFVVVSAGADATEGGRRSPLGALFIGLAMMANGAVTLRKIDEGDF